jgi:uncharacterized protein YbbC (DUF1343 family)
MITALLAAALAWPAAAAPYKSGADALLESGAKSLRGKRAALITHPAAVTASLEMTADALFKAEGVTLVALMGPEHGIRGAAYAGEKVADEKDPKTGLPVFSLYGKSAKPTPAMLKGVDALVYDVQDIGARSYTYISTLALAMEAAAEARIPLIVLDRPDPTGGARVEGGLPPEGWKKNFINFLPVPYVYGMTPGELALMINGEGWLPGKKKCKLEVVKLEGWRRGMPFSETGRPWVPTSPHIPRAETSVFYAATGIVGELGVLNEGVGYPLPFELLGAPWLDGEKLAGALNALKLPGVAFRPLSYKPYYGTHKGVMNGGVQIHLLDAKTAPWTAIQFHAVEAIKKLYPERDFFAGASTGGFDRCLGSAAVREHLQAGKPVAELLAQWEKESAAFSKRRAKYLLYD